MNSSQHAGLSMYILHVHGVLASCAVCAIDLAQFVGLLLHFRTMKEAKKAGADKVISSGAGRGRQMNAGAQAATGQILVFLHADTLPPTDLVSVTIGAYALQMMLHPKALL